MAATNGCEPTEKERLEAVLEKWGAPALDRGVPLDLAARVELHKLRLLARVAAFHKAFLDLLREEGVAEEQIERATLAAPERADLVLEEWTVRAATAAAEKAKGGRS